MDSPGVTVGNQWIALSTFWTNGVRRTDDVIIGNFFLLFLRNGGKFFYLEVILPDWVNDNIERGLNEAVDKYEKQEEGKKQKKSSQKETEHQESQSIAIKEIHSM